MQFATGDSVVAKTVLSGAIWAICLVPPKIGVSSGAAELVLASAGVNEAVALRIQTTELRQGPWGPTSIILDALAVLHGTAALYGTTAGQVSRKMKYLAA